MKCYLQGVFTTLILFTAAHPFAQQEIIDKVFKDKPADFRNQIVIEDTLALGDFYSMEDYGSKYTVKFGLEDFEQFLTYRNKVSNKVGLIVCGKSTSAYTDAVADSIWYLRAKDPVVTEYYDELGYYVYNSQVNEAQFYFDLSSTKDEYWTVSTGSANYAIKRSGTVERDLFKAVRFTENLTPEGSSIVTAVYANLQTNKIVNSAVLNERVTINEVYAYHYDNYGEYDYYYDYAMPETDYSIPYFETRMNYEPIEIVYILAGDTIADVLSYTYPESDAMAYNKKALPDDFSGVWKSTGEDGTLLIIDGDDMWSYYGVFVATIDTYKELYQVSRVNLDEAMTKMDVSADTKKAIEAGWKGSKSNLEFIGLTMFSSVPRYKDFYISNDDIMAHVYFELDAEGNKYSAVEFMATQKVNENYGFAKYDNYTYATVLNDLNGKPLDLYSAGVEYYYNYNLGVADRNIDKEGNLILTNESLGSIHFSSFTGGNNYIGKVKYQWIGSDQFDENATVVSLKSLPYKILDQTGKILADDVFSMFTTSIQGFNLYQVYNSNNKVGVIGPDGAWMVKQEWDAITITGPSAAYGYDGYGSIGLPVFFLVMKDQKYGALDSKGNWIVPMGYDYIEVCSEQLLANKNGKISIYSFDGKMLIDNLDGFAGGYYGYSTDCYSFDYTTTGSRVLVKNEKFGIVDDKFNVVVPFIYTNITALANTTNFIAADENAKYGLITEKNEIILPFQYDIIQPFDYYPNKLVAGMDGKQGVIDPSGNVLIPFEFYSIATSSDWATNMIYISDPDYRTNIIDTTGKSVIDAGCSYLYYYPSYEIFYCSTNDGQFNFYNKDGEQIYSKVATYIDPYSAYDYVQIIQMGDYEVPLYGAFDLTSGADLMPCSFESLYPFWISDQIFFAATKKDKIGIYSIDGKMLVKHKGMYLDNYYYESGEYGGEAGYYVEISNKKGKSKLIRLDW